LSAIPANWRLVWFRSGKGRLIDLEGGKAGVKAPAAPWRPRAIAMTLLQVKGALRRTIQNETAGQAAASEVARARSVIS
jgi:hypothetical protein